MIPTKKEDITLTTTVEGESIRMRIDEDATEHIIALLTDLYSDPEAAIIREVSTNALDSHIAARQTKPVLVSTPTALSPIFRVQDFGLGLDADDFRNIYSLYGRSTKTDTNEQVGSLGLGCKSPLTYTNLLVGIGLGRAPVEAVDVAEVVRIEAQTEVLHPEDRRESRRRAHEHRLSLSCGDVRVECVGTDLADDRGLWIGVKVGQ